MNFDFNKIDAVEFGVCARQGSDFFWRGVPMSHGAKEALGEMAQRTIGAMRVVSASPVDYEASEGYAGLQHLRVTLDDPIAKFFSDLWKMGNFEPGGSEALRDPRMVFCYGGKFQDTNGNDLFGVRRSALFKGVLKQKSRLMSLVRDELQLVQDDLFRLDNDFDVLVDGEQVIILRVAGFEAVGELQKYIIEAAAENVKALNNALSFVRIGDVDTKSVGIAFARKLAAVMHQPLDGITSVSLRSACDDNGIPYSNVDGMLEFSSDSLGDLLDVLDRRLYVDNLVQGSPTLYKANSRRRRA